MTDPVNENHIHTNDQRENTETSLVPSSSTSNLPSPHGGHDDPEKKEEKDTPRSNQ